MSYELCVMHLGYLLKYSLGTLQAWDLPDCQHALSWQTRRTLKGRNSSPWHTPQSTCKRVR